MQAFVQEWRKTRDWRRSAQTERAASNGALMRIAPVVVQHTTDGSSDSWADAVLGTAVTHNDPAAIASSVAFVGLLDELLSIDSTPMPEWWVETFLRRAEPVEGNKTKYRVRGAPIEQSWSGSLCQFIEKFVLASSGLTTLDAAENWYSGAYLLETVPTVLHILMHHSSDPEEAIVRAVNDTKDNDTIGAIVGAAVGALHGESALPRRWVDGLLGRTVADVDDRKLFGLIASAEGDTNRQPDEP